MTDASPETAESAAKRKERLLALRSEALSSSSSSTQHQSACFPSPPLLPSDLFAGSAEAEAPTQKNPRFDYYTNPSAAFSTASGRRMNRASPPPNPRPGPSFAGRTGGNQHQESPQAQISDQPAFHAPPLHMSTSPQYGSPRHFHTQMSGYRGPAPYDPHLWSRPVFPRPQPYYHPSSSGFSPTLTIGVPHSPIFIPARSSSPHNFPGQGRGYQHGSSPGARGSGGRGRGFQYNADQNEAGGRGFQYNADQNEAAPYYYKSMTEDPWCKLAPTVGNILEPRDGSHLWLPKSLSKKKIVEQPPKTVNSELSLAEYLSQSFNEAVNEKAST